MLVIGRDGIGCLQDDCVGSDCWIRWDSVLDDVYLRPDSDR